MSPKLSAVLALSLLAACVSTKEHERLLGEARILERSACDKRAKAVAAVHSDAIQKKEQRIKSLETDLNKLGIDLKQTQGEMSAQLASTQAQLEQLKKQRELAERDAAALRAVADKLRAMIDAGTLEVITRKGRMTLKLPDEILFPPGSRKLKPDGKAALLPVIEVLKNVEDREFLIAGHTDNVPVKQGGGFKSNWDLSTARALEIVSLMIENGVAPERVAAAGYGEFDPIAGNDVPEERAKNRRLEIILMPKIEDLAPTATN